MSIKIKQPISCFWFLRENTWRERTTEPFRDFGWGNGYVAVDPAHPWASLSYDELNAEYVTVHYGLTYGQFAQQVSDFWPALPSDLMVFGFDTSHYADTLANWPKERVEQETISLWRQFMSVL